MDEPVSSMCVLRPRVNLRVRVHYNVSRNYSQIINGTSQDNNNSMRSHGSKINNDDQSLEIYHTNEMKYKHFLVVVGGDATLRKMDKNWLQININDYCCFIGQFTAIGETISNQLNGDEHSSRFVVVIASREARNRKAIRIGIGMQTKTHSCSH